MNLVYWLGRLAMGAPLKAFFGLDVVNPEKRIEGGPAIIAANHASFMDPPVIGVSYDCELHYLARETLFKGLAGRVFAGLNAVPNSQDQADLKSIKRILRALKEGKRVVIFPEGSRTFDGKFADSKAGVGMMIAKSKVPVQPVRIVGSYEAMPRNGGIRFHPVKTIIGDVIEFTPAELNGKSRESYQAISDRVMEEIGKLG